MTGSESKRQPWLEYRLETLDRQVERARHASWSKFGGDLIDPTEDSIACAFAAENAGRIVYDHTVETWFTWQEGRWNRDTRKSVFNDAREFTRAVRRKLNDAPVALSRVAFVSAVERAARADPKLAVSHEVWNQDIWLLGTPDGVVDLRDGMLRPSAPDLYINRHTNIAPAPVGTVAPLWSDFLDAATNHDKDLQAFLQRPAGYLLTGDVTEEVLTFLHGEGGNGKGVFMRTLHGILGEYAVAVPIEVFTAGSRVNPEYYRAQIAGARMVTASETEAQATWAELQIKELTGNDSPISARHPHGQPFTYFPQFKIALVGNHAPKLKGRSAAMERRLRVVPFAHSPKRPDQALKEKLKSEYPAILRWMLEGCAIWQRQRLGTASEVAAATSAYFDQQDAFRRWIEERCILEPSLSVTPGVLLTDFNTWAKASGEETVTANDFAQLIDRTPGLKRHKTNGARLVRGIGLQIISARDGRDDQGRPL